MGQGEKIGLVLLAAVFFVVLSPRSATIKEDAEVYSGRDKKIGMLHEGAQVAILEESGEWMKVRFETMDASFDGYVKSVLVDTTASAPLPGADSPTPGAGAISTSVVVQAEVPASNFVPVVVAVPGSRRTGPELGIGSHWQMQSKSGSILAADMAVLLKNSATPAVNLAADKNYALFKELYYLMPVADALKKYGQVAASAEPVNTPGFPVDSFKTYSFDPKLEGISKLTLMADMKGQLVAVQTTDSGMKKLWLYRRFSDHEKAIPYSKDLKLYDLALGRAKGSSNWRVGAIIEQIDGVVHIDTELIDGNPEDDSSSSPVRSKERIRLYLPQPVANLCAYLLQQRK